MKILLDGKCTVYFFDNIQESQKRKENSEEMETVYSYDMYVINPYYRENLQADIEESYQVWLDFAKKFEFDELAKEIREKRDELLAETDKEMVLDRLKIEIPEDVSMTTIVTGIKQFFASFKEVINSEMAKYRQKLRDIPQQERISL